MQLLIIFLLVIKIVLYLVMNMLLSFIEWSVSPEIFHIGPFSIRWYGFLFALGFVVGLEYEDPLFEPYQAFLSFKKHPLIADIIQGGKVLQQGAKTLPAGGYYTMPRLALVTRVICSLSITGFLQRR